MVIKNIDFEKYNKMAEKSFYRKLGKVVNVVGLTIESAGPDSKLGDLCRILPDAEGARPIMAEVVGFRDKKTLLMPYDSVDGIGLGCVVENTGDPLKVTVNDKLLGKTVNGLGVPIDGEMINGAAYPVEAAPPDPMSRTIIDQVLPLGVKAVDGMITVGKGQRIGIFAGSGVGKSTLISVVSAAKPEIANYHFTTLTPVLGVVRVDGETSFVMADIPGLIEGASEGLGLGHEFLRHVDRCRLIVHVVDVSGIEGRDPIEDFKTINTELRRFNPELAERPMLVAGNKCDMATEEQIAAFREYVEGEGYRFFPISAATRQGTEELVQAIAAELAKLPPIVRYEPEPITEEERLKATRRNQFTVEVVDGVYVVKADWLANALTGVNMEDYESLQYFQRVLIQSGIIKKLEDMGINEGDTVSILDFEFEYVK